MTVAIVNQWAGTFAQSLTFGTTPPALQSTVIALTPATSVGGGSGTPTAGNWLVCIAGWNQKGLPAATVAANDDIHGFWRPGNETTSTWSVSAQSGNTRTAIWYTANPAAVAGNIYVAPNGVMAGMAALVIELSGTGNWDTVTGVAANYAAAATSLTLALGAPSAASFVIAAVCGDNDSLSQAFAPGGWTTLHTVTATNGSDHTCDAVITSAILPSTSSSVSVSGTTSGASDLSGAIISFQVNAASPIPAAHNPNWPLVRFEAAFGGGFQTPPDQLTWTDLSSRLWSWDETTGVQYQLGDLQATNLDLELDNFDNLLASDNPASYFYTYAGWAPQAAFYDALVSGGAPLAWWKLADASGTTTIADSSGNSHTGTATSVTFGNTSEAVTGNTSASFASGSTSHVISSYNPSFTALSVEAWVNLNGLTQSGNPRLVANSHTDSDSKGFQLFLDPTPHIYIGFTSGTANIKAPTSLPSTGWTHIAATYDGTSLLLYVNGVQVASAVTGGTISAGTAAGIGLGYGAAYAGDYLNGLLAECAIYGTALTASQVAARYMAGPAVTGTPLRIRAAIGTIGGVTANRWYVIQRNAEDWPQQIDDSYRRFVSASATDIWSAMSNTEPTPYRGEILQDSPYAWWPMDDQPLSGGVLPTTLLNAASGNANTLTIQGASGGVTAGDAYTTTGTDATTDPSGGLIPGSVAVYAVGQQQGWMYGDPQSSQAAYATTNPVTANPGSAAWQQTGMLGSGGTNGWFLTCNDTGFPPLASGLTFSIWFDAGFFGSAAGYTQTGGSHSTFDLAAQPYSVITIAELATASAPVAILQLDLSGNLNLITYNGGTGTSHTIYSASDMRSSSWHNVTLTTNGSTWTAYLDGGLGATVSGSGAGMTSAWTWLIIGADLNTSGGSTLSAAQHMGNAAFSHAEVFPAVLPAWRILAHYCAAATGFGVLPAPQGVSLSTVSQKNPGVSYVPDGSAYQGSYGGGGLNPTTFTFSALAVTQAGSYTSGPSARVTIAGVGTHSTPSSFGDAVWASWTGLAPSFGVYTAASANAETNAATVCGSGDSFTAGFGSGATGAGVCQSAAGTGASPPTGPSSLGDTVQQRIERLLAYGNVTYPGRCIDPAALAVQAATDIGGQPAGLDITNITGSDGGLLYVDNQGNLTYWQRPHLAGQYSSPVWQIGPANSPYYREIRWLADPQRVWDAVVITPFSPDGTLLPLIVPTQAAQVTASQRQFGAQPKQVTSYLQSQSEMQNQANSLFQQFGTLHTRAENVKLDAAPAPSLFPLIFGMNIGDVVTGQMWQIGTGGAQWTFRVSEIKRHLEFNGDTGQTAASVTLKLDFEPTSYWA